MTPTYTRLIAAIKRGKIKSSEHAAEMFGVSRTTIANYLRQARAAGYRIATRTGDAWAILGEPR